MRAFWLALLAAPAVAGMVAFNHDVGIDSASQATFAPLSSGDVGTATIGASQTSASVSVSAIAVQLADDILDITSTDGSWQVHAEYVSHTGFTGLTATFALTLRDGATSIEQIHIANGVATKTSGAPVDLPATQDTEVVAQGSLLSLSGTLDLQLVLSKDTGTGPVLRYDVSVAVGL